MILTNRLTNNPLGLFQNFDRLFDQALRGFDQPAPASATIPGVYDYEPDEAYVLRLEIPGFSKDEISLSIEDGEIVVTATASDEASAFQKNYNETFTFPDDAQTDAITAKLENGVLELTLPKREPAEPKVQEIKIK